MSDYDRNVTTAKWGQTIGRVDTAAIDQGLRSYMLSIYNYMVIGLAITGLAALGIYMLSVTGDAAAAMKVLRNGAQVPVQINKTMFMTPVGYYVFVSPLKWVIMLAPLAMVFLLSFGMQRMRPATAQVAFWIFAALMGLSLGSPVGLYDATRSDGHGLVPDHGAVRHHPGELGQFVHGQFGAAVCDLGHRRPGVRGPHRL
jgi:FtsH-binding integral membrane protein